MRIRIAIGFTMLCALAASQTATASAAAATAEASKKISGRTSQDRPFRAVARDRSVQIKRFVAELDCRDGTELILTESGFLPSAVGKGGRVRDYQFGRTDKVWIRGRVTKAGFRGTLRVTDVLGKGANRTRCNSGWFKFQAD